MARAENVTQIVIGASSHSRWREFFRGSVVHRIIRDSGPIDVHVIGQDDTRRVRVWRPRPRPACRDRRVAGHGAGVIGLTLLTVVLARHATTPVAVERHPPVPRAGGRRRRDRRDLARRDVRGGFGRCCVNWYFTEPIHTWTIAEAENVLAIAVFVFVGVGGERARRSRRPGAGGGAARQGRSRSARPARRRWLVAEEIRCRRSSLSSATRSGSRRSRSCAATATDVGGRGVRRDRRRRRPPEASDVIELRRRRRAGAAGRPLPAESRRVLSAFAAHLSAAVRAARPQRGGGRGRRAGPRSNELRTAILAAVSHDLRTPLASIKAAASSLASPTSPWTEEETDEFLATIEEETDRLSEMVGNLLDMSRIQTRSARTSCRGRWAWTRWCPRALASLPDSGRDIRSRCRRAAAGRRSTPPCWNARSPTSPATRSRGRPPTTRRDRRRRGRAPRGAAGDRPRAGHRPGRPRPGVRAVPAPRRPLAGGRRGPGARGRARVRGSDGRRPHDRGHARRRAHDGDVVLGGGR